MKDYEVIFEYDDVFDKIEIKIIQNNKIVFIETVTNDVLRVAREYEDK